MKKTNKILSMILGVAILFGAASCKEDEPDIGGGGGTIAVGDGFYITQEGVDPVSTSQLKSALVDAEGFSAMAREGFVQNYVYLTTGSYNLVEVTDKTVVNTFGGTVTAVAGADAHNAECDESGYNTVAATLDGAAFSIATDGLYTVSYDATLSEIVIDQMTTVAIIGDATPGGWDNDTDMTGSITADGGSWEVTGVILKVGVMKFRYNCRWAIDRRIDTDALFDNANGYTVFTNYGNAIGDLLSGNEGPNIPVEERAEYTVTFSWDPASGVSATLTRTGDAPVITFDPADWKWGVLGDATANQWDADMNMYYGGEDAGTHSWYTAIALLDAGSFKFRINDAWDTNLGGTLAPGVASDLTLGGADLATPGAGAYYIVLQTADEGASWTATMSTDSWGVIGDGSPQGDWSADVDMDGIVVDTSKGVETYTITGDFTTAGWKFRAGNDWAYNLGGDAAALSAGGADIVLASAGNYTVVLSYDGEVYSYVATEN